MNRLVLLRHGRNRGHRAAPVLRRATDLPLLEDGVRELKDAARRGVYPAPGGFFVRHHRHAADHRDAARHLRRRAVFRAGGPARGQFWNFEMKSYEEVKSEPSYQAWLAGDWFSNTPPQGESFRASEARIARGLEQLLAREEDTICICHGGTILTAMQRLFPRRRKRRLCLAAEARLRVYDRSGKSRLSSNFRLIALQDFVFCVMITSVHDSLFAPVFQRGAWKRRYHI